MRSSHGSPASGTAPRCSGRSPWCATLETEPHSALETLPGGPMGKPDAEGHGPADGLPGLPPEWGRVVVPDDASALAAEAAQIRRELRRATGLPGRSAGALGLPLLVLLVAVLTTLAGLLAVTWPRASRSRPADPGALLATRDPRRAGAARTGPGRRGPGTGATARPAARHDHPAGRLPLPGPGRRRPGGRARRRLRGHRQRRPDGASPAHHRAAGSARWPTPPEACARSWASRPAPASPPPCWSTAPARDPGAARPGPGRLLPR